jgi:hypothetical protein
VRVGDYNIDGYPDLLLPIRLNNGSSVLSLWQNIGCNTDRCGDDYGTARTFSIATDGMEVLASPELAGV